MSTPAYASLMAHTRETWLLGSTGSLLWWDERVMIPPKGQAHRGEQLAVISRMVHERSTDPRVGEWLAACEADAELMRYPTSAPAVNVRELRRSYDRASKLPAALVEEMARTASAAQAAWAEAKKKSEFALFRPWLEKTVELQRKQAACLGTPAGGEAWDALADAYEPGMRAAEVAALFGPLRARLAPLAAAIAGAKRRPSNRLNELRVPIEAQARLCRMVVERMGFDLDAGRIDVSSHPFCGTIGPGDVRLTTRYQEHMFADALGSSMHEAGHGLYEQNLPHEHAGSPMGEAAWLTVHESQSRLWENHVGRSAAFWRWLTPQLPEYLGDAGRGVTAEEAYGAVNLVAPSLIRVESDELTYHLHIMIRFELERALISGSLSVADLPGAWNARYKQDLGLEVPDDARGCLQDIHWSGGAFGYFPTYTLGSMLAAQLWEAVRRMMPDVEARVERAELGGIKAWLNERVHAEGQRWYSRELCERVTGHPLTFEPLLRHLEAKFRPLYGL